MQELDECFRLRRNINKLNERIEELKAFIEAPKSQIISDMPKGGSPHNAIEEYIIKVEKIEHRKAKLQNRLSNKWREVLLMCDDVSKEDIELIKYRFYYGLSWKKCAKNMEWNENKCFRVYRRVLSKINK